jgi:putative OPT family oligopeptide transporter
MLAIGAVSSALVMAPMLNLLSKAYGIAVPPSAEHPNPLLAPQANLMASVAKGIFGGELPWTMIGIGAAVGAAIIVVDEVLKSRGAKFRVPVLACAVGIYLPVDLAVPIFFGGLLAHFVERRTGGGAALDEPARERLHQKGTLFSAGLITGEALMGILIAVPIVLAKRSDALALPEALRPGAGAGQLLGLAMIVAVAVLMYRMAVKPRS